MTEADASGVDKACRERRVSRMELARRRGQPVLWMVTERPIRAATGSTGLPGERGQAKIEHVVESRLRLLLIFRH